MNPNLRWATLVIGQFAAAGLRAVCVSPGSRSTPLTLAAHAHPDLHLFVCHDERGAAFFALGMALADDKPVALICSSGTAVANYLPAVIEAAHSQVPLLLLTADRPPELRGSGANQTIDQIQLYGSHVLHSVDMPLPELNPSAVLLRSVCTTAARAYALANGALGSPRKGPVHLNFPFRKPLQPSKPEVELVETKGVTPTFHPPVNTASAETLSHITALIQHTPRGLILCGPRCPSDAFPTAVTTLAAKLSLPLLADPLSGLRFGTHTPNAPIIGSYDAFLDQQTPPKPDFILRFGALPVSKTLNDWLASLGDIPRLHVRANGIWADDDHTTTHFIAADEADFCRRLTAKLTPTEAAAGHLAWWLAAESHPVTPRNVESAVVPIILEHIPANANFFVGNSMAIRYVDRLGRVSSKNIRTFGNRGASGIDGNIATAIGCAAVSGAPAVLLIGDVSTLHDLNSMLLARHLSTPFVVIVINNNGGTIFRQLPIAAHEPPFTELFVTPHGLHFQHAAALFGWHYQPIHRADELQNHLTSALSIPKPTLIELKIP